MMTTTRQPLDKTLRRALEATVTKARDIAEQAASQALKRLNVGDAKPADYLNEQQRDLRNRLRAHGRQVGDIKTDNKQQGIAKLLTEVAYQHWHRMLFARFLERNKLLMYDEHTTLTLPECNELAQEPDTARDGLERRCTNGWELAGVLASKMLPQVFRIDSPVFELEFAPEHQRALEQLVTGLALETFQAQDSLGWVYQFWQSKRKKEVNDSEVKIGADELSPVTQLFTEPYMVSFLLDNSLGAWWAGQRLSEADWQQAQSEQQLREKAAIPGVPLTYLRFVKDETTQQWQPASGTFDAWPQHLSELKALDPCCGSGHFLVAAFLMLVPMRMQLEDLTAKLAIDRVLSENLHGLELDQRCVELAAFAVALEAWRFPDAGGYRSLPELHLACSGVSINAAREEWKVLGKKTNKQNLSIALDWMYQTFKDAPVLGSLINPRRSKAAQIAQWSELQQLLGEALAKEAKQQDDGIIDGELSARNDRLEAGIVAQGLAKAAEMLSGQYTWVVTNVPYLARGKQNDTLKDFCETNYPAAKNDLATVFLDRCLEFCTQGGTASIVLPQNWLFLTSYRRFREKLLQNDSWHLIARLGAQAFQTPMWDFNVQLLTMSRGNSAGQPADLLHSGEQGNWIRGVDVSEPRTAAEKAAGLLVDEVKSLEQGKQLGNPNSAIELDDMSKVVRLGDFAYVRGGITTGDSPRFRRYTWEVNSRSEMFSFQQSTVSSSVHFSGRQLCLLWEKGDGELLWAAENGGATIAGRDAWNRPGIAITYTGSLKNTLYSGDLYENIICVLIPKAADHLSALWEFCSSDVFEDAVRSVNQKLSVDVRYFEKTPIDIVHWEGVALEQYPDGLPKPYTNDPTQWIFHGHPCGSVIWDEDSKWTANGERRVDDTVLQVAVVRLLGYRWPAELDPKMELAAEQRAWVERCDELLGHADDDSIVCLPAVRGEKAADQRLEALLQAAYGEAWTTPLKNRLLETVGSRSLNAWLREKFFEQHCKLFQHRPFIWHIWDGLKDGFSVLVNYHKLDKAGLERLIYTYLGDWIRTQQVGMANGEDGADIRLTAAETLKKELDAILQGEAPYDIFVRWKPLSEQPVGWTPDINDGVRLNIRPFLQARDLGKKGAGILRWTPNIKWAKDRGKDVESAPWYSLGLQYNEGEGARVNDHHLTLEEKRVASNKDATQ